MLNAANMGFAKSVTVVGASLTPTKHAPSATLKRAKFLLGGNVDGWKLRWSGNPGERVHDTPWGPAHRFGKGDGKGDGSRPNGKGK